MESALRPIWRSEAVSRRKWTPSTSASTEVAVAPPGTVIAASSPLPRRTCGPRRRQSLAKQRQQLELTHRLTIPERH